MEPDDETANTLADLACARGFEALRIHSAPEAEALRASDRPVVTFVGIDVSSEADLEMLGALHLQAPGTPLLVISERTDPDAIAVALSYGGSNVIRRPLDIDECRFVLDRFYRFVQARTRGTAAFTLGDRRATELSFKARPGLLSPVIAFLVDELQDHFPGLDGPVAEVKLALYEAFANAMEHGNLEISFEEKTAAMDAPGGIRALLQRRLADPELAGRKVFVRAEYRDDAVGYVVRDEGTGFDYRRRLSQPMAETTALHGRGLKMIEFYMDEVAWNDCGNEVRMHKHVRVTAEAPIRPDADDTPSSTGP